MAMTVLPRPPLNGSYHSMVRRVLKSNLIGQTIMEIPETAAGQAVFRANGYGINKAVSLQNNYYGRNHQPQVECHPFTLIKSAFRGFESGTAIGYS